jgi:membrane-bound metal-dependent hydrolase YbcI (DUF457 family)
VLHLPITGTLALAGLGAGFATIPDLDTAHSCASRSLGFLSATFALAVAKVSGGHRHGSHSLVGVAVFTALAWLACHYRHDPAGRWALALFLALALAAGLRALRIGGHFADLAAIAGAGFIAWTGWELALVPLACALGCLTHLAGDSLTVQGVPLAWPVTMRHFGLPRPLSFTTGTWRETWVITPALFGALGLLAFTAIH